MLLACQLYILNAANNNMLLLILKRKNKQVVD